MTNNITDEEFEQWQLWALKLVYGSEKEKAWATEQMDKWLLEDQKRELNRKDNNTHETT